MPMPAVCGGPKMPGKSGLEFGSLALGSMMSKTGPARQLSPGRTISNSTRERDGSSSSKRRNASASTINVVPSKDVAAPKRIAVIPWIASFNCISN